MKRNQLAGELATLGIRALVGSPNAKPSMKKSKEKNKDKKDKNNKSRSRSRDRHDRRHRGYSRSRSRRHSHGRRGRSKSCSSPSSKSASSNASVSKGSYWKKASLPSNVKTLGDLPSDALMEALTNIEVEKCPSSISLSCVFFLCPRQCVHTLSDYNRQITLLRTRIVAWPCSYIVLQNTWHISITSFTKVVLMQVHHRLPRRSLEELPHIRADA